MLKCDETTLQNPSPQPSSVLSCPVTIRWFKTQTRSQMKRIRCFCMFMCKTSLGSTLGKCQRTLPSVSPTGSFKEVSPCPPWWHLQLLSSHSRVLDSGSDSCHLFAAKIIQIQQLQLWFWIKDMLCRLKNHNCLLSYGCRNLSLLTKQFKGR